MKIFLPAVALSLMILALSCSSSKKSSSEEPVIQVEVQKLTAQDSYPGIESNLRKTRTYRAELSANVNEEITIANLLVDSIRIPIRAFVLEGDMVSNEGELEGTLFGEFASLKISVGRHFYNEDARNQVVEPIEYELSGVNVEDGHGYLEYRHLGELKHLDLGTIESLQPEYHQ